MMLTNRQIPAKLTARENFRGNTMRGETVEKGTGRIPMGQLSGVDLIAFMHDRMTAEREDVTFYVVWSYSTPIAWKVGHWGWTMPDTKYSQTTTRHQGIVRRAI